MKSFITSNAVSYLYKQLLLLDVPDHVLHGLNLQPHHSDDYIGPFRRVDSRIFYQLTDLLHEYDFQSKAEVNQMQHCFHSDGFHYAYLSNCKSVGDFFSRFIYMTSLISPLSTGTLLPVKNGITFTPPSPTNVINKFSAQGIFTLLITSLKRIFIDCELINKLSIYFIDKTLPDEDGFYSIATRNFYLCHDRTFIFIPHEVWNHDNPYHNPLVEPYFDYQIRKLYRVNIIDNTFIDSVLQNISRGGDLHTLSASVEQVAHHMNLSRSSLYRKLAEHNTSYSCLLDLYRKNLTMKLLSDPNLSIGEISDRLGYSTHSSFARAFQRWFNAKPTDFRTKS